MHCHVDREQLAPNFCNMNGLIEGLAKWKIEGKIQGKIEVAKKMKFCGMDPVAIKEITDIDIAQLDIQ